MLIGIDPLLSGELLAILRDMGHGDTIAICDSNFPATFLGPPAIRMDTDALSAGRAVLSVLPLDSFIETPIMRMEGPGGARELMDVHKEFLGMAREVAGDWRMGGFERFRFYEEARNCVATIATLERRGYANFILTKGVIDAEGKVRRVERPAAASPTATKGPPRRR